MGNFHDAGLVAATTGIGTNDDSGILRNIAPNRRVQIRRVQFNFADPGVGGGWGRLRIVVTDAATAAVLFQWSTAVASPATNAYVNFNDDIRMYFNSGVNGVVVTATIEGQAAGADGACSISGRYL